MGLLDWFTGKRKNKDSSYKYAAALNGFMPIFSQFGNDIYASDVVEQAIGCIVTELQKLNPHHVRKSGRDSTTVYDDVERVLKNPNDHMTLSDFLGKIGYQLYSNYNSFVIPTWKIVEGEAGVSRKLTGLYPIQPSQVDFLQDKNSDRMAVKFTFANGYNSTLWITDVIHIKFRYHRNEFMGGDEVGQPNNKALLETLQLNDTLLKGIASAMKASYAINGAVKYNTMLDDGTMEQNLLDFQKRLQNNESGLLGLDLKGEFIPVKRDLKIVDEATLKFVDSKILRHYGISTAILNGDYTKQQYEAFYQKALEPIIIALSQAFTKTLFTDREKQMGNEVIFYASELVFMTFQEKLEMVRLLGDAGDLLENEKRTTFGFPPLPELEGVRLQSLNYVDVSIAKEYQFKNADGAKSNLSEGGDKGDKIQEA